MYYKSVGKTPEGEVSKVILVATSESESELLKLFEETNAQNLQVTREIADLQRKLTENTFEIDCLRGENKALKFNYEQWQKEKKGINQTIMAGEIPKACFKIIREQFHADYWGEYDLNYDDIIEWFKKLEAEYWGKEAENEK